MDSPGPIHDFLLVFLESGLLLGSIGVVSYFVAAPQLLIYLGEINV